MKNYLRTVHLLANYKIANHQKHEVPHIEDGNLFLNAEINMSDNEFLDNVYQIGKYVQNIPNKYGSSTIHYLALVFVEYNSEGLYQLNDSWRIRKLKELKLFIENDLKYYRYIPEEVHVFRKKGRASTARSAAVILNNPLDHFDEEYLFKSDRNLRRKPIISKLFNNNDC